MNRLLDRKEIERIVLHECAGKAHITINECVRVAGIVAAKAVEHESRLDTMFVHQMDTTMARHDQT